MIQNLTAKVNAAGSAVEVSDLAVEAYQEGLTERQAEAVEARSENYSGIFIDSWRDAEAWADA